MNLLRRHKQRAARSQGDEPQQAQERRCPHGHVLVEGKTLYRARNGAEFCRQCAAEGRNELLPPPTPLTPG